MRDHDVSVLAIDMIAEHKQITKKCKDPSPLATDAETANSVYRSVAIATRFEVKAQMAVHYALV